MTVKKQKIIIIHASFLKNLSFHLLSVICHLPATHQFDYFINASPAKQTEVSWQTYRSRAVLQLFDPHIRMLPHRSP